MRAADYSGMVGGPAMDVAQGATRDAYDPQTSAALAGLIRRGLPIEQANAYLSAQGYNGVDPDAYAAAVSFAKAHHGATNVQASRTIPTTLRERFASSPAGSFLAAGGSAATAGLDDAIGRSIGGDGWDVNRAALTATNPTADFLGNAAGSLVTPELMMRTPIAHLAAMYPRASALGGFMSYGGTYGASENPEHPLAGGLLGAVTGGILGPKPNPLGGLAGMISPSARDGALLYDAGGIPGNDTRRGLSAWPPTRSSNTSAWPPLANQ